MKSGPIVGKRDLNIFLLMQNWRGFLFVFQVTFTATCEKDGVLYNKGCKR